MAGSVTGTLGCALLGAGRWGRLLGSQLTHVEGLRLVGVLDLQPERARHEAEALGVPAYGTLSEVLADPQAQAVVVAVPNHLHAETALAAIHAGKHVLLEKPMALTVKDALAVHTAARDAGVVLMIDHIQRYYAPLVRVQQLVAEGTVGEVQGIALSRRDLLHRTTPWLQQRQTVGGLLYQSACHEYDFLCWLCGDPAEISCVAGPDIIARDTLDYPDLVLSQIRFRSGVVAQVWDCMTDPLIGYDGTVTGREGSIWFDLYRGQVRWSRLGAEPDMQTWQPGDQWAPWAWIRSGGMAEGEASAKRDLLVAFRDALEGSSPPPIGGRDGIRVIEMAQAGYLSLAEGRPVPLPLHEADAERLTFLELKNGRTSRP